MAQTLDSALTERLRAVLDRQPVTEVELRKLTEEGGAWTLILSAQLVRSEKRLAELESNPASSFAEIAAAFRCVGEFGRALEELQTLLAELQGRARECRAAWLRTI